MNFVEPIKDKKKIAQIKNTLRGEGRYRDLLLFTMGINTALRVSDLVRITVGDVYDKSGRVLQRFCIREEKRNKRNEVVINESMKEALEEFSEEYPKIKESPSNFLFFNTKSNNYHEPIKRGQAWKFVTNICKEVGLRGTFGTHSLRKTWGYHARMSGVDLALIMHKLNHSNLSYTKRYLGVTDDELGEVVRRLNL